MICYRLFNDRQRHNHKNHKMSQIVVKIANYHRFIYILPFENHGNHGILC
jgi:hypothetical protein